MLLCHIGLFIPIYQPPGLFIKFQAAITIQSLYTDLSYRITKIILSSCKLTEILWSPIKINLILVRYS